MGPADAADALDSIGMPWTSTPAHPTGEVDTQAPDPGRTLTLTDGAVHLVFDA